MHPEFTLNGIEYTARRFYTSVGYKVKVPVAAIRCEAAHPEDFEPGIAENKKKAFRLFHHGWIVILLIIIALIIGLVGCLNGWMNSWEDWLVLIPIPIIVGIIQYFHYLFIFNEN